MGLSRKRSVVESPIALIGAKRKRSIDIVYGRLSPHQFRLPIRKQVTFASNNDGSLKTNERFLTIFRADLDKANMWYSREERGKVFEECEEAIDDFRLAKLDEKSKYISIFDQCTQMPSQESSDFLETAQLDIPASARGMEWGWAGYVTETYKRNHVRALLRAQKQMQGLSPAMRDSVLASRSLKTSRAGRVLARLLGECDARNAKLDPK